MARGKAWSDDLRWTILHSARSHDIDGIIRETGQKRRTIERVLSDYKKTGTVSRQQANRGSMLRGRRHLTTTNVRFLQGSVRHRPDLYLDELKTLLMDRCGVEISESTVWRALKRSGFTMKKLTREAVERNDARRAAFRYSYGVGCVPEQTVFVDESSFDRRTSIRGRAWALSGQRATRACFFVRGKCYSLLPALSTNGMIYAKVVEGSFKIVRFPEFIEGLLDRMEQSMAEGSVIIMDNARIHKDPSIRELIEARGYRAMFLPPYSPDYNPIELAFSAIKAYVRRHGVIGRFDLDDEEDDTYVYVHLLEAAFSITRENALGWFHHCGYL